MFTGIYPHTAGAWANNLPLGDNILTMGQRFRDNGYRTAYVGKWHLDGHDYFGTGICPAGWEEAYWYDGANYLSELSEDEITLWRRGLNSVAQLRAHDIRPAFTWAHRVSERAIQFLRSQGAPSLRSGQAFLLVVSYDEPHHPYTCPPEYAERFVEYDYPVGLGAYDDLQGKPAHHREWAASFARRAQASPERSVRVPAGHVPRERAGTVRHPLYLGCNSFVDSEIGRVIDAVHRYAPDDTYIIFTSDHGDMLGAHQLWGKGPAMYEEIAHIPLIVEPPGGMAGGAVNETLVSHIDLLPTMLALAGLDIPPILEGESIVPLMEGQEDLERAVHIEFQRYEIEHDSWGGFQPVRCIVKGRFKLVLNLLQADPDRGDELYDLKGDPAELHNLIAHPAYAGIRDMLHDQLLDWMYARRDPFRGPCWERRPWRTSRRFGWRGAFRPRPADGYAPVVRDYDTGLPATGVKERPG
jgi:uncharacterized sulfatase